MKKQQKYEQKKKEKKEKLNSKCCCIFLCFGQLLVLPTVSKRSTELSFPTFSDENRIKAHRHECGNQKVASGRTHGVIT